MRDINIHIKKLIADLKKEGISFYFDLATAETKTLFTGEYVEKRLENVVFEKNEIEFRISETSFFRKSGQSHYFKSTRDGFKYVELDDKTFYDFKRIVIINYFKNKKK